VKVTFFAPSVVGYSDYPDALFVRGLAQALGERNHIVRVVEPRQNHAFARTIRCAGSHAARQFYSDFTAFQHHTYEPRTGGRLLEWATRELALIDAAIVIAGSDDELCRWVANIARSGLRRYYLTFEPDTLTPEVVRRLELRLYDAVLAPRQPAVDLPWRMVRRTLAQADVSAGLATDINDAWVGTEEAAATLLTALQS
jgi:hypothetical protein